MIAAAGYDPATPVAVGVSEPSKTVLVAQPGDAEGREFDCDSVAYAGSLAKQITGACAAEFAQGGALDVEAPIAEWLPELPAWAATIRVRHLVHHTAALPGTDAVWDRMTSAGETDWTSDGVLAALATVEKLDGRSGDRYVYSNVGYICLARIVERLSGVPLDAFARTKVFEPLQMRATTFWSGPAPSPPTAVLAPRGSRPHLSPSETAASGHPSAISFAGTTRCFPTRSAWRRRSMRSAHSTTERHSTTRGASVSSVPTATSFRATAGAGTARRPSSCGSLMSASASPCSPGTAASNG